MEQNALVVDGLTKQYRDFTLDHISFCVPRGSIVGLIGENGAGKSTAIQAILGLIQKDAGSISLLGKTEEEMDAATRNRQQFPRRLISGQIEHGLSTDL